MKIVALDRSLEAAWREFLSRQDNALFYSSLDYRDLLQRVVGGEPRYLLAMEGGEVCGVLPAFVSPDRGLGTVLNSLPYYGSNGGAVTDGRQETDEALVAAYLELEESSGCVASTLIGSPFEGARPLYEQRLNCAFRDSRVGQLTPLPESMGEAEERLFEIYDESARRNVRKARKSGVIFRRSHDLDSMRFLHETHEQNIRAVGGLPKSWCLFQAVRDTVPPALWTVYVAEHEGAPIAALLLFRFNRTVEYYTPAIREDARPDQPLALLVHEAMCQAARDGYRWFNWGGTWASQGGVYRFKKKWGARDMPYYYYCRLTRPELLERSRDELLKSFPGFFVVPFDRLAAARSAA